MIIRPSSAAPTNNGASEIGSIHCTRRGSLDGNLFSAVVAIARLKAGRFAIAAFFVNASANIKLHPASCLSTSQTAALPWVIVGGRAVGCNPASLCASPTPDYGGGLAGETLEHRLHTAPYYTPWSGGARRKPKSPK